MPYFEDNPLNRLAMQTQAAAATLDLRGKSQDEALQALEQLLGDHENRADSYRIRFDAASNDGRETLFLPLGRRLLDARRAGDITRCLPESDGAGYFIAFRSQADTD